MDLSFKVVGLGRIVMFTGCTGMIQGINEHVATYSLMA